MAKKIKFGLAMPDGTNVRTIEDLREHFDLETTIVYFLDGKLMEWLEDRYYDAIAKPIRMLCHDAPDFKQKLCDALGVVYAGKGEDISLEDIEVANAKKARLKQLTSDEEIISHAAETAFSQEELAELLDADKDTIYLCGEEFHLPTKVNNRSYIGILGMPKVYIDAETMEELTELNITLTNVTLPEHLQTPPTDETAISNRKERRPYEPSELFAGIVKAEERDKVERLYTVAQDILGNVVFDPDLGTRPLMKAVQESNLKGAFARWLKNNSVG